MRGIDLRQIQSTAKKIASILAENEATVKDVNLIFKTAKSYMIVKEKFTMKNSFESFGQIRVPDNSPNGDGIRDK